MISRWSWDWHQQCLVTSAPSLEAADSFLMGRVGTPVGFASEKVQSTHSSSVTLNMKFYVHIR